MDRRDLLLAVLAASDGQPYQPVQIQKAMFLVVHNLPNAINSGPTFAFTPYDYGPFDLEVYNEAERLSREGLVTLGHSETGRWRTYAASPEGLARGRELLARLDQRTRSYVAEVSQWVRELSFSSLVRAIYDAYPDMRINSVFRG